VFARLSAERLQRFNADEIWIEISGYGKAVPPSIGCRFIGYLLQRARRESLRAKYQNLTYCRFVNSDPAFLHGTESRLTKRVRRQNNGSSRLQQVQT
jgi:hypothetical protein